MSNIQSNNKSGTKKSKLKFEDVDLSVFLGPDHAEKKSKIHTIIAKIADDNPEVTAGIEGLLNESVPLPSFERAIALLINPKNKRHLQAAEAALQVTMNEVKSYHAQRSPYMTTKKTALYLYTLQYLVANLSKWKFQNGELNTFKPALIEKLEEVQLRSICLGIRKDVIRNECFSRIYQDPKHPVLANFEFLDEQRLDAFSNRLKRYEITGNALDYPATANTYQQLPRELRQKRQTIVLEKIISHIEDTLGIPKLDLDYLTQNTQTVRQIIGDFINANDQQTIDDIIDRITRQLGKHQLYVEASDLLGK